MTKEKEISELNAMQKLVKERITEHQRLQEMTRREIKQYEELAKTDLWTQYYLRNRNIQIFERKAILNALQKHCLEIRKRLKKLNREQEIRNNDSKVHRIL